MLWPEAAYEDVFQIDFLLEDKLKVFEGGRVTKNYCCYEQKIINIHYRQVRNREHLQLVVYNVLHNDLRMDSQTTTRAKANAAAAIRNKVLPIAQDNHLFCRVTKNQCCYEQKIINLRYRQVQNKEHLQQLVYNVLHNDLRMDSQVATRAKVNVTTVTRNTVLPIAEDNDLFWTYLLELHIDCTTIKRSQRPGPTGEHGYNRLLERIDNDECNICADEFDSPPDIIVTTCHHTFDRSCIMRWLNEQSTKTCRTDLSTMVGSPMDFPR